MGRRTNQAELLQIASEPKEEHKFDVRNFHAIKMLQVMLVEEVCGSSYSYFIKYLKNIEILRLIAHERNIGYTTAYVVLNSSAEWVNGNKNRKPSHIKLIKPRNSKR